MDSSGYPGDVLMADWKANSPFKFTGFYLYPAANHNEGDWMAKRSTLVNQGWGILPIYVGKKDSPKSPSFDTIAHAQAAGVSDAQEAVSDMQQAGFPMDTYIYHDIEDGAQSSSKPLSDEHIAYLQSFSNYIQNSSPYWMGVYCSYSLVADYVKAKLNDSRIRFWVFRLEYDDQHELPSTPPSPTSSGVSYASSWQLGQSISATYGTHSWTIDVDTSNYTDPGY